MAGGSITGIMALAGPKTTSMAARYNHLSPEHTLSVMEQLSLPMLRELPAITTMNSHQNSHWRNDGHPFKVAIIL